MPHEESLYPADWLRLAERDWRRVERLLHVFLVMQIVGSAAGRNLDGQFGGTFEIIVLCDARSSPLQWIQA
jgi:hypothetical protein